MRCFSGSSQISSPRPPQPPLPEGGEEEEENNQRRKNKTEVQSPTSSSAHASTTSTPTSSSYGVIDLRKQYILSVQTNSFNEIWSKIHRHQQQPPPDADVVVLSSPSESSPDLISQILQPNRASIDQALLAARPSNLTRLVSLYLDSSETTSHLFLSLRRSVENARTIYTPITELMHHLPSDPQPLSQSQCDWAFNTLLEFDTIRNPFPGPTSPHDDDNTTTTPGSFNSMRQCFAELKQLLDVRLHKARRRHKMLRNSTRGSAACLIASVVGAVVAGVVIATHALVAVIAVGPGLCMPRDMLGRERERLRNHMVKVDSAAREMWVLDNNLDTIEKLVERLYANVQSDKGLVRLGLERGRGQRHSVQEVVRHLRKNHSSFLLQLTDLDEHICVCLTAVNRARSLLLQQIN